MKKVIKLTAGWLMIFILAMVILNYNADTNVKAATNAKIEISDTNVTPGGEFEINVTLRYAKGVGGYQFKISYDNQKFEFISGESIAKVSQFDVNNMSDGLNVMAVLSDDISSDEQIIFKIKFKAKETVNPGQYKIGLIEGELVNATSYEYVSYDKKEGCVNVNNVSKGDLDGNGKVNITDAMRVFHYVSGRNKSLTEKNLLAADINGDGKVNIVDAMKIFHFVSGRIKTLDTNGNTSSDTTVSVTGVSISKTSLSLTVGDTSTLTATVSPSNATNKNVTWSSSNTSVATVDSTGKVTANGAGTATITVKTADGAKTATCAVTVKPQTVSVTGVSITNKITLTLDCNSSSSKTYQCAVSVSPSNATNKSVIWSSSNTSVATVDSNGKITAVGIGTATITVTTNDGGKKDTINVYVYKTDAAIPSSGDGNTWYRVSIASTTNRVMDVYEGNTYNGAKVEIYSVTNSDAQLWQFHDYRSTHGGIAIVPKCNSGSFVLDVNRGSSYSAPFAENNLIDLWTLGQDDAASMWQLVKVWDGTYIFKLINTDWVAGITSHLQGAQLMLRKFDLFDTNQKWCFEAVNTGSSSSSTNINLNSVSYSASLNPFAMAGYGGQCTAFVWGRTHEKLGISLPFRGNAITFWTENISKGYYAYGTTPKANSIAVWSDGSAGHVAFVESVSGNSIIINEANFSTYKNTQYGGGYDGAPKTLTASQMQTRYGTFMGYIYLQ